MVRLACYFASHQNKPFGYSYTRLSFCSNAISQISTNASSSHRAIAVAILEQARTELENSSNGKTFHAEQDERKKQVLSSTKDERIANIRGSARKAGHIILAKPLDAAMLERIAARFESIRNATSCNTSEEVLTKHAMCSQVAADLSKQIEVQEKKAEKLRQTRVFQEARETTKRSVAGNSFLKYSDD